MPCLSPGALFSKYSPDIVALPRHTPLTKDDLRCPKFLLQQSGNVEIYYAPLDYLNRQAEVILVGITPGWTQMEIAYRVARDLLDQGAGDEEVLRQVDRTASFAGVMRQNLVTMLDALGLPGLLGIPSSASLFGEDEPLLHTTSLLRYPVFVRGENYHGSSPASRNSPVLRPYATELFVDEMAQVPDAVIIPLGQSVAATCQWLEAQRKLPEGRCLVGFPHPSGANGHRVGEFERMRPFLQDALHRWFRREKAASE